MTPRLPTPGSDDGQWGEILNDYLLQSHTSSGSLKSGAVTTGTIADDSIAEAKLEGAVRTKLNGLQGPPGPPGPAGPQGPQGEVGPAGATMISQIQGITISATPPSNPAIGDLWVDLST